MTTFESLSIPMEFQAYALQAAIGGLGVCAVVLTVARCLRRRAEPLRYAVLFAGVIGLLAVPMLVGLGRLCQDALPAFAAPPPDEVVKFPAEMLPALLEPSPTEPAAPAEPSMNVWEILGAALVVLWLAGTLTGVCRLLIAFAKQRRALVGSPWSAGFWTDELKARLARQLGLKRFPAVHRSPAVPMPMVVGLWRPRIVLPDPAPAAWQQPQWEAVLLHEAAHIARGDPWAVLAQRVAVILFWWCPLVYPLSRRLHQLRENICDDLALQGACDRISYAQVLVESAEHFLTVTAIPVPVGLLDSTRSGLETRVSRLLEEERPKMTKLSMPGKLLGAALLVTACLLTTGGTALSGGQPPPQKKILIKIIVDGKEIDLTDPALFELIAATQRKAAEEQRAQAVRALGVGEDERAKALNVLFDAKAAVQTGGKDLVKELAFSPDGKTLVVGDGKKVIALGADGRFLASGDGKKLVWMDSKTGKIIAQYEQPSTPSYQPDLKGYYQLLAAQPGHAAKADPRIEELVKQAEAIKPGSGAEIRKALQAAPKADDKSGKDAWVTKPPTAAVRLWEEVHKAKPGEAGKKIIVIQIEDGKVIQLNDADLRKLLDKEIRLHIEKSPYSPGGGIRLHINEPASKPKVDEKQKAEEKVRAIDSANKAIQSYGATKKAAPGQPAPDLESLMRQVERLNAELDALRKRLEEGKK